MIKPKRYPEGGHREVRTSLLSGLLMILIGSSLLAVDPINFPISLIFLLIGIGFIISPWIPFN